MGRKSKFKYDEKINAVLEYQKDKKTFNDIAQKMGVHISTIEKWVMIYESQGMDGLMETHVNRGWKKEIKIAAVSDYLSGQGSQSDICKKYKISSKSILQQWIKVYNDSHKELKNTGSGGRKPMTKARKTTFDERIEIVQFCIANGKNYGLTMDKFNVSYKQIYLWVRKYEEKGVDGLLDRRGKAKPENELTELDRLKAENKMLAAKNQELQMEIDIIKKLKEVERRYR